MEVKVLQDILIKMLCSELNETELDSAVKQMITPHILADLFNFAKKHDVAHIVASCLYKNGLLPKGEAFEKFQKEQMLAVYRNEQIKFAYSEICQVFNKEKIPFVPLKGSVIRPFYPEANMRTSCDIDVLISKENLQKAVELLKKKGYRLKSRNYHDVSLFSPANVHIELHFSVLENLENIDKILQNAWDYTVLKSESCYEFTDEFFVFQMLAHMSYHFLWGGFGVRFLMDVWVMEHKMGKTVECAEELLEQAGIYKFAQEVSRLANICFSGEEEEGFSRKFLKHILEGGIYGNTQNRVSVKKSENPSTVAYIIKRWFAPYKTMAEHYPVLKKAPILLPIFWIVRLFKILARGRTKEIIGELKTANSTDEGKINEMKEMRAYLEL